MKYCLPLIVLLTFISSSCSKMSGCAVAAQCIDEPPTNEACQAMFRRWFYMPETDKCELVSYSGCNPWGFETEAECNECKCKK